MEIVVGWLPREHIERVDDVLMYRKGSLAIFWCSVAGLIAGMFMGGVMNSRTGTLTADGRCDLLTHAEAGLIGAFLAHVAFHSLSLAAVHMTVYEFAAELFGAFLLTTLIYLVQRDSRKNSGDGRAYGDRVGVEAIDSQTPRHKRTGTYS